MAVRNPRYLLLSAVLLAIVFLGIYLLTATIRAFAPGYILAMLILLYTGTSLNRARNIVSPPRFPIMREDPEELGLPGFEEVQFKSRDGLELSGWYIPSKNTAAVVMVHSLGSSRIQMRHFSRALAGSGYGILLFDLRGHARSAGSMSAFGWIEHLDALGAYDFLAKRPEVDSERIGVLGFSLGAQIAVRAAAESNLFYAVWVDGPIPVVYQDHFTAGKKGFRQLFFSPWWGLAYNTLEWITGLAPPPPLADVIGKVSPRPLFVAAAGSERLIALAKAYFTAANEPCTFWQLDDIPFGTGVLEFGDDYDFKLIGFFNRALR